jgi:hypothetical protein
MPVEPRMQVIPAVVSRVAGNLARPQSAISIEEGSTDIDSSSLGSLAACPTSTTTSSMQQPG